MTTLPSLTDEERYVANHSRIPIDSHEVHSLECRLCHSELRRSFVDLGAAPPCEAILTAASVELPERAYPLHVRLCERCLLVQLPEVLTAREIFDDEYAYFSSYSTSWVEHARRYTRAMIERLGLGSHSRVIEVASNDGYLLRHFRDVGIPCLGIEPTAGTAAAAIATGVPTEQVFLSEATAVDIVSRHGRADLVVANNVYAHVPDLGDFTRGLAVLLQPRGLLTLEFPHLMRLIEGGQYDTIYHEHFQYYTLLTAERALRLGGLTVVDVEELATHGGSLRVFAQHDAAAQGAAPAVADLLKREASAGLHTLGGYSGFEERVRKVKRDLLRFLLDAQEAGLTVVGYGAPGKGNTLLNHCGIRADLLQFTVDRNPNKHGKYLPGSRIVIRHPDDLAKARPDYILVMPWNLRDEITEQLQYVSEWGAKLVFAIPRLEIVDPAIRQASS